MCGSVQKKNSPSFKSNFQIQKFLHLQLSAIRISNLFTQYLELILFILKAPCQMQIALHRTIKILFDNFFLIAHDWNEHDYEHDCLEEGSGGKTFINYRESF